MKSKIIVLAGFSASGKDTIARLIEKKGINFIVSSTTRPMRDYESEGDPYYFVDKRTFRKAWDNDEFVEIRTYETVLGGVEETWYYGVLGSEVKDNMLNVVVLDMLGLRDFKKAYGDRVIPFFLDCDDEIRRQRIIDRGDYDEKEFNRRLEDDKERFPLEVILTEFDYKIDTVHSTPEESAKEIFEIIRGEEEKEIMMEGM